MSNAMSRNRYLDTHKSFIRDEPMRRTILNNAAYLVRHIRATDQWVDGLTALEWNAMTSPLEAVDGQDRAKDELCVRLSSTWFSHDACLGVN